MYWADPETGCSPNFWLRAMGWFLVAMVDVLERMDEQLYNEYRGIMAMLKQAVEDMHKFQDEQSGMFWQVIDHPEAEGNYLETSGTALFAYAVLKGVRLGYLPNVWLHGRRRLSTAPVTGICPRTRTAACSWTASALWRVWAARITVTVLWPTTSASRWSATMPRA